MKWTTPNASRLAPARSKVQSPSKAPASHVIGSGWLVRCWVGCEAPSERWCGHQEPWVSFLSSPYLSSLGFT